MATGERAMDDRTLPPLKGFMAKHGAENRRSKIGGRRPDRGITPCGSVLSSPRQSAGR
jgi:hypothetical protein